MEPDPRGVERLGAELGRAHDALLADRSAAERAAARRRVVAAATAQPSRSPWTTALVASSALAAAAAVAAVVWWAWPASEKQAGPPPVPHTAERWLAAPADAPLEVTLADETRLTVAAGGRIRVAEPTAEEQRIVLEAGALRTRMPKDRGGRWRVAAGPFEVRVTGTEFTVGWEPEVEWFSVELHEGSVRVVGPLLADGREVTAGQTLRVFGRERLELTERTAAVEPPVERPHLPSPPPERPTVEPPSVGSPPVVEPPAAVVPEPEPPPPPPPPAVSPSSPVAVSPVPAAADWEELARARQYAEALAAARAAGLERLCESLPASGLARLADVARFARDSDAATGTLDCLRRRFPGTPAAAEAAFTYGRVVADVRGNAVAATAWFETYLREAPDGALAREALGRLLEMYDRLGNAAAARRTAVRYLERFPDGAHAALARRLVAP
ncbi:MAG: FecR domain-containing protein [Deltaproteobacteria bacterium]|nr:FecR domain-containing protein [Deltaproteobacteria bacterium]